MRTHKSPQRLVLRARIVLLAAVGRNNSEIADEVGCDLKTARKWRERFVLGRMDGLEDEPRSGRPARFGATEKHDLFSLLVGPPPEPYVRWTCDLLADEMIKRRLVSSISTETVSYWLRTADVKPHRCRYWLTSNDPDFEVKKSRIVELYLHPPKDGVVVSVDEKTCIQALERIGPRSPATPRRSPRIGFEYKRHGVANLLAAFEVTTGRVFARCVDKNDSAAFIRFLRQLMKRYPVGKIYLILDNGSSHRSHETKAFFEQNPRLVPTFTPTHASWLNQVEIWFSLLGRQVLKNASFESRSELVSRIMSFVKDYNRRCEPFRWTSKCEPLKGPSDQTKRRVKRQAPPRRRAAVGRRQRAA